MDVPDPLAFVEAGYHQHFEVEPIRASVSFVGVEPIEVLRYPTDSGADFVTLGMSRHPMTDPTSDVVDETSGPRAELLLSVRVGTDDVWRQLAVFAAAPAVEGVVYSVGNRVDLGAPLCSGSRCTGVVIAESDLRPIAIPAGDPVSVLRLWPATSNELAWARVHGASELRRRWSEHQTDLGDLTRASVDLT